MPLEQAVKLHIHLVTMKVISDDLLGLLETLKEKQIL